MMPGGDGRNALMRVEIDNSGTDGPLNAKWKLREVSTVRDFPPGCGPSHVPKKLKAGELGAGMTVDFVAGNSEINNIVLPSDGIPNTTSVRVKIESSETNGKVNAGDGSGCLRNYYNAGFDCKALESETNPARGVEKCVVRTRPSEMPLKNKVDIEEENGSGRSHLLSSACDDIKPVKLKIKFCHRNVSAVRDLSPIRGMNISLGNFEVKPEAPLSNQGKKNLVSSLHGKNKVVHGIRAAPYCPIDYTDNEGNMKLPKRKSVSVNSNRTPKQSSGGPSKRRAFIDWHVTDRNPGSSTFLDVEYGGAITKRRANTNPTSMFNPDLDDSPGKSCDVNPFWRNKFKAVARKSICQGNILGNKTKEDFPVDSLFTRKRKGFDVRLLPRFGPNKHIRGGNARSRVRETLMLFHSTCRKLLQREEAESMTEKEGTSKKSKKTFRIDLAAAQIIKNEGKEVHTGMHFLGAVPGVEVGDAFQYRVELALVGIHRLYQAGIDSMKHGGIPVANSIVTSGSYDDDTEHADVLIYSGQGGNIVGNNKNYEDQKLEKGNLALSNSMKKGTPVRVVRGWKETIEGTKQVSIYYYDGLYTVQRYWEERGSHGKMVLKFKLTRNPGQPELVWKELKKASKSKFRQGLCVTDISRGREKFPICVVNELDDEKPPRFTYISKMKYPNWHRRSPPIGCNCVGKCNSSGECACAIRNGGKIPYTYNGSIVEDKLVVYECGPHCKCPPTCYNRVSQRGINFRLEIFKTKRRGWGLRALTSIPSGGFVCEYVGELIEEMEAEIRVGNDEYLFDIGQNILDSSLNNEEVAVSVAEEGGYTIDACHFGNVGRFINHSCSPNLYAQNVIHDHDDKKMPRIMLFARENIPAFQELTFHYNYKLDQVFHPDGKIKIKKCFCGSADCRGSMY